MKLSILVVLISVLAPAALLAQTPPAAAPKEGPGPSKIAIIDFQRAIVENTEGKTAQNQFMAEINKRQADIEKRQKSLEDMQNRLRTQDKALSDAAKADLTRQIDQVTTELNRLNEDAQKELGDIQQRLFRPIAERAGKVLNAYAAEGGLTLVFDVSSQASSIVYAHDGVDITEEVIRRIDADVAKTAKPAEPARR